MAKSAREKIRLVSSAGTGHFYTTDKNKRNMPEKMEIKKHWIQPFASISTRKPRSSNLARFPDALKNPAPCRIFLPWFFMCARI